MTSPYLTRSELRSWSERYNLAPIIAWLKTEKIAYVLDADGWPKVARALHDRRLGLVEGKVPEHHSEPDFTMYSRAHATGT